MKCQALIQVLSGHFCVDLYFLSRPPYTVADIWTTKKCKEDEKKYECCWI